MNIAALLLNPQLAAGMAALAGIVLTLVVVAIRRVFSPKAPTVHDVATAQAGETVAREQTAVATTTAQKVTDMAQAATDAPTAQGEVVDSLNKGEF